MADRLRALLQRFLEWWGRFSIKQKVAIISAVATVVVAVGIAAFVLTRPVMEQLIKAESAEQSASVRSLLEGENIYFERSTDGMTFFVKQQDYADARILLGTNSIPTTGYSINDVVDGSFATTESDKQKKYTKYLETQLASDLETLTNVKSATVILNIPKDDGTLIANQEPTHASIKLTLVSEMDSDQSAGIARFVSTALGNDTTEYVMILDNKGNVLFSGGDEATSAGIASSNQKVRQEAERLAANKVKAVLSGNGTGNGNIYDNVEIGINLDISFDNKNTTEYRYWVADGQTQGYLDSRHEEKSQAQNGVAGVPGTDANDDTTYVMQDNEYSRSSSSVVDEDYLPNETITTVDGEVGVISYDNSSISVVAFNYVAYNEDEMKATGQLEDITFAEFAAQNNEKVQTEVPEDVILAVSNATRIPVENITILAYDVPMFNYSDSGRDWTDWLQIALAILIIAMLGFVVFRTLRREEEEEVEAEVSVEELMETEEEVDLEAVKYSEKSEARLMIEKFIDERPEAVATLLRNWLNEEWGE